MKELFFQAWIIQVIFTLVIQGFVFMSLKTNRPNYGRFVLMTGIYMVPVVGMVFVLLVAVQAFKPIPQGWAGNHSVFDTLAEGYED
jgi:F0F1-type ATP synthase membrane subunit a